MTILAPNLVSLLVIAAASFVLGGCETQAASEDRFEFILYDGLTDRDVAHLQSALESAYGSVLTAFELEEIPVVKVQIWKDELSYQEAMEARLGSRSPGSRGYVTGNDELRLLYHTLLSAQAEAVHEFAHVASLNVNPGFGNNPRWLWEAVAIHAADEFVHPEISGAFANGACPTLDALNSPFDRGGTIYDVGYLLIEFIHDSWGRMSVIELIQSNGNLPSVIDLSQYEFETRFCNYVHARYPTTNIH